MSPAIHNLRWPPSKALGQGVPQLPLLWPQFQDPGQGRFSSFLPLQEPQAGPLSHMSWHRETGLLNSLHARARPLLGQIPTLVPAVAPATSPSPGRLPACPATGYQLHLTVRPFRLLSRCPLKPPVPAPKFQATRLCPMPMGNAVVQARGHRLPRPEPLCSAPSVLAALSPARTQAPQMPQRFGLPPGTSTFAPQDPVLAPPHPTTHVMPSWDVSRCLPTSPLP